MIELSESSAVLRTSGRHPRPEVVLHLAELSALAYQPEPEVGKVARRAGWAQVRFLDLGGAQIHAIHDDHTLLFITRSCPWTPSWIETLLVWKVRWRGAGRPRPLGRIQVGIHRLAVQGMPEVLAIASQFKEMFPAGRVFVAGHGFGGALAYLLTVGLAAAALRVEETYSFSAPRPGDGAFASWYDAQGFGQRTHRVVYVDHRDGHDLLTRVPLSALGWRHPGVLAVHTAEGILSGEEALRAWSRLKEQRPVRRIESWRILSRARGEGRVGEARSLVERLASR